MFITGKNPILYNFEKLKYHIVYHMKYLIVYSFPHKNIDIPIDFQSVRDFSAF